MKLVHLCDIKVVRRPCAVQVTAHTASLFREDRAGVHHRLSEQHLENLLRDLKCFCLVFHTNLEEVIADVVASNLHRSEGHMRHMGAMLTYHIELRILK